MIGRRCDDTPWARPPPKCWCTRKPRIRRCGRPTAQPGVTDERAAVDRGPGTDQGAAPPEGEQDPNRRDLLWQAEAAHRHVGDQRCHAAAWQPSNPVSAPELNQDGAGKDRVARGGGTRSRVTEPHRLGVVAYRRPGRSAGGGTGTSKRDDRMSSRADRASWPARSRYRRPRRACRAPRRTP